ncbi:putative uncharacterized protein [Clostridium sp. CAG:1013]|nr:putative uncharacterized protein [Clostridium sp. CAG:1013]
MGNVFLQLGELLLDVIYKGGAARAGQEALFRKFCSLGISHHVSAQSGFHHVEEAQLLDTGDDLAQFRVAELAGNGGSHHSVELVVLVIVALLDQVHHVQDEGLVHNGAKGALVHTGAAGNASLIVDMSRAALRHADGFDLAGVLTGTLLVDNGAVRAHLSALAALHALGFVDMSPQMLVKSDGSYAASVLAPVSNTAPAGVADIVTGHGALIASDVDDLDDVGVLLIAAHSHLDTLSHDGALFVDAAPHSGLFLHDELGDLGIGVQQPVLKSVPGYLAEHLVFEILYLGVKFSVLNGLCGHYLCTFLSGRMSFRSSSL